MLIHGKCHCGNIAFSLRWEPDPIEIPARACDCSFCTSHGAVWTSHPNGSLRITIEDEMLVSRYLFGTKTAEFLICARCGVVPVATSKVDEQLYAVVNVHALEQVDPALLRPSAASFGVEDVGSRLARRKRYWIADVAYESAVARPPFIRPVGA